MKRGTTMRVHHRFLLLMLAAAGALVQFSRRAQRLAELQMEFVAGVSHELRTPLSVIRTAAHNLGGRIISTPSQVQRYGALIEEESEKLTGIIDRVLLFANAKAGRVIQAREIVDVEQNVNRLLPYLEAVVKEGMITMEHVLVLLYRHGGGEAVEPAGA